MARPVSQATYAGTPWPAGRLRVELRQLFDEVSVWFGYRHRDLGESFAERGNRLLRHLRARPDAADLRLPDEFEFQPEDYVDGELTISEAGGLRLVNFLRELASYLPGGGVAPRTAFDLSALHPKVQGACAEHWRAGEWGAASRFAAAAVLARLRQLAGPPTADDALLPDADQSLGQAAGPLGIVSQTLESGRVRLAGADRLAQQAVSHLVRGLVEAVCAADGTAELSAPRAYELLALASLLLHRLEFAVAVAAPEPESVAIETTSDEAAAPAPTQPQNDGPVILSVSPLDGVALASS